MAIQQRSDNGSKALALTKAGIAPGLAAGRAGKGILVQDAAGIVQSSVDLPIQCC